MLLTYRGKNSNNPKLTNGLHRHSQYQQDETVIDILRGKIGGYFIDLAANDAAYLSNTLLLEQKYGWRGLCIEPNPDYVTTFVGRKCQLLQAAAGAKDGQGVNFTYHEGWGGVVHKDFDNKQAGERTVELRTVSLETIFRDMNVPSVIDYMSLDIEGAEEWVLSTFPWHRYTFCTLSIERPDESLIKLLEQKGYIYICDHGNYEDKFFVHSSLPNLSEVKQKYGQLVGSPPRCDVVPV